MESLNFLNHRLHLDFIIVQFFREHSTKEGRKDSKVVDKKVTKITKVENVSTEIKYAFHIK